MADGKMIVIDRGSKDKDRTALALVELEPFTIHGMLVVDDLYEEPRTPEEAEEQRLKVIKWFDDVMASRLNK